MTYNVISRLSESTKESVCDLISHMIGRAKKGSTNEAFKSPIIDFLFEKEKMTPFRSYTLIGPKYALGCLVGSFLYNYASEEDLELQVDELVKLLDDIKGFQTSHSTLLKQVTAEKLIDAIEQFGMPEYFFRTVDSRPLRIYFIPYQHKVFNGVYYPYLNSIVSYRPRQSESKPEYVFVHEMGHLLAYNLTGDPRKVPESFIEFNKKFNPSWDGKGELIEIFVDLFSMAVMTNTAFAVKNPLLTSSRAGALKIVSDYFTELTGNLKYNPDTTHKHFFGKLG